MISNQSWEFGNFAILPHGGVLFTNDLFLKENLALELELVSAIERG